MGGFGGYSFIRDSPTDDYDGYTLGAKAVGSYKTNHWYLDAGLRMEYEKLEGSLNNIELSDLILEIEPRYRITRHWSLGSIAVMHYHNKSLFRYSCIYFDGKKRFRAIRRVNNFIPQRRCQSQ